MFQKIAKWGNISQVFILSLWCFICVFFANKQPLPVSKNFSIIHLESIYSIGKVALLIISSLLMIAQILFYNYVAIQSTFFKKIQIHFTFLSVVFLSFCLKNLYFVHIVTANLFLVISIYYLIKTNYTENAVKNSFYAGFFLSIAGLLYFPYLFFVFFLYFLMFAYKINKWRAWVNILIGFILPFLYVFAFYSLFLNIDSLSVIYERFLSGIGIISFTNPSYLEMFVLIITLIGLFSNFIFKRYREDSQNTFKHFRLIQPAWIIFGMAIFLFFDDVSLLLIVFIPIATTLSFVFSKSKKSRIVDVVYLMLILSSILFKYYSLC